MHNFMVMLLACSFVMSLIALFYMALNPLLAKRYSEKGRYYVWLIILLGLIIPIRPQWNNALIRLDMPSEAVQPIFEISSEQVGNGLSFIYVPQTAETTPIASAAANISLNWWQVAFAVWLFGLVTFLGFHYVNHYFFMKRVKRWSKEISDDKPAALLESLKTEMGITRHISLMLCEGIGSPMMLGFVKPRILLPTADLAQDELCFILRHELVHYKRRDLFYKLVVLIATAIHWFNPIIYVVAKAINAGCELSCDAEIVQNADDNTRRQYSETIIGIVRYKSKFKTVLSTTFYGGRNGMKNRIFSIMTTSKKRTTLGSMSLALALVSVLTIGTLTAFAAERPQPEIGRPMQNIGRFVDGGFVPNPEWEEMLQDSEVRFYELDQVTPFDFTLTLQERLVRFGGDGSETFRIDRNGRLTEWSAVERADAIPRVVSLVELAEKLGLELPLGEFPLSIDNVQRMTLHDLGELLALDVEFLPRAVRHGDSSYNFMREQGKSPIIGNDGAILMWVPQSFFEMTYEEFNELAEQLLTTAVITQTRETVDILREHWFAAQ